MTAVSGARTTPGQPTAPAHTLWLPLVVEGISLYLLCFALLGLLIFATPGFLGNDDYYHARISAEIIGQRRLDLHFPWLPQTILSPERFVDHHLLYHLYLAPWVHVGGITGAKLAQVAIAAGVFLAVWVLLRGAGVRWPFCWSLALFALSSPFLYRLLMIRTQAAALLLLILALHRLFQRRHAWLVPLSFAFAWLYDGFILMPAVALIHAAAGWLVNRRFDIRPVVYSITGIILGLVINPYFPRNLLFIIEHLGAKVDLGGSVEVGSEWYPYTTGALLEHSGGALLVLLLGLLRPTLAGARRNHIETTLRFVVLLTLFMLFRSRRFIEYYPAFALLFASVSLGRQPAAILKALPRRWSALFVAAVLSLVLAFAVAAYTGARETVRNADDPRWFVGASNWLARHTPEGAPVFQTDWDDFTRLFYYNTFNTYLVGLDPTYLQRANPRLWDDWVAITRGEVEYPSRLIRTRFGAEYVVSDRQHEAFATRAYDDPGMKLVYWDKNSMVWQLLPADSGARSQPHYVTLPITNLGKTGRKYPI